MKTTLYKRNAQSKPIQWKIDKIDANTIKVEYGLVGGNLHIEKLSATQKNIDDEILSMIKSKRKEGYKSLTDLYDNAPEFILSENSLYNYLNTYLPKFNTHADGNFIPMLCKTLEDNKPFEKGSYFGQWKINGERCIITAERSNDLFAKVELHYRSREGVDWTSKLSYLDEFLLPRIKDEMIDMMVEEGVALDGELYLPGYGINEINSFIKNTELPQHYQLQFWCYDICIENMTAENRRTLLYQNIPTYYDVYLSKDLHYNCKERLVGLPGYSIFNINEAIEFRDLFISYGFEGLVIREKNAEYQFGGKRNNSMLKFKKKEDGLFEILAIKEDKRGLPIFTLKNDINDELFDATINLPQDKQRFYLEVKDTIIGKKGLVEYRERSGIKQVPFHAKLIKIHI
jgi:hypothetical protein